MDITDEQWGQLGDIVGRERRRRFGSKKAAYDGAKINAATWDKLEAGIPIREDRLIAALNLLWPSAGGDVHAVLAGDVGARQQDDAYVSAPGDPAEGNVTLADVMREIKAMRERLDQIEGERGS